ncbi:MAG: TlpA family protein disulfide reductase [Alishewanella sp.]|uniref:TlpA family protein disulfide reductase n=1 Tax=Rheinheimera sp. UJ63 TaxID=2910157 RepID=UPI001F435B33|nr:TlpA disulfide reductase family protein [Rheinheimera sp. UJ63]MCF4008185.1 TlpA family protein disulfide reductase [Rheinheimera sp. UJ63]MDP5037377.1 TlpA family protein disulfide reductase [Alishewanella sp.]
MRTLLLSLLLTVLSYCAVSAKVHATDSAQAPDFTLKSLTGVNLRLAEQRGEIIVLNFWASWCSPCLQEMPALDQLANKYRPLGVQVWGVNVEADSRAAQKYLSKTQVQFPILFDTENSVSERYQVQAMPTTVIINQHGDVFSVHRGYKPGYEQKYEDDIKTLLRN